VIVVDDGSADGAADRVAREFAEIDIVGQPRRGVTAAWNHGARLATTERLVFLNNDAESHGPWMERLTRPLLDPDIAITGAADRVESAMQAVRLNCPVPSRLLEGWCFALRRRELVELGGFDESLKLYFSDTDLQIRMWQRRGGRDSSLYVARGLPIRHAGHRTTRRLDERRSTWLRDRERFLEKWSAVEPAC
jgi:GT2 family glycosyltransferase